MTSLTLAQIFKEEKVPDAVAQQLCSQLTINSFACICAGPDDLLEALKDALDAAAFAQVTPVVLACSKASYHRCISTVVSSSSQPQSGGPLLSAPPGTSSSWVEPFPAKLSIEKVSAMKSTFEDSYPSEIVDSSSMPSSRLLAACNKQVQEKHYSYIAWRFRLSEEKLDEIQASRPRKIARLDDCIFDEVPSRDISDSGVSQMFLAHLLDLLAFDFACWRSAISPPSALTASFSLSWPFKSPRLIQVYAVPTSLRCNPRTKRLGSPFVI